MKLSTLLSGNAPVVRKFQIGETWNGTEGIPVEPSALANNDGVLMAETNDQTDVLGISLDAPTTRNTAQQSDGSDPAAYVSVIINSQALWHGRLSGGSTSGTALTAVSNTTADTTGLLLTFSATQATYDDGYIWGATGANAGILRKITAVTTTAVPIIAFPADIAVGDTFYLSTFGPGEDAGIQLTSTYDELDATADVQTTAACSIRCVHLYHKDAAADGSTKTWAEVFITDHFYGGNYTSVNT